MKDTVIEFIRGITDGGAETLLKDYSLLIDKEKFNVKVITLFYQPYSANYKTLSQNNIPIYSIYRKWDFFSKGFNKLFGKRYVPYRLKKIIKVEKPTSIHAHMTVLKYLQPISKELREINLFYTCHSLPECYFSGIHKEEYSCAKYLIEHNDLHMIALHRDMANKLNSMFDVNNTTVIRNGIDFERFVNLEINKNDMRNRLAIPENAFVVGHVGRFHPIKNHKFIVEVFRKLKEQKKNAFLLLVGDGEECGRIKKILHEYNLDNSYLILSNRTDIPKIMRTMDVFIFPSLAEGLGIALIEAQLSNLRCVVSDTVPSAAFLTELVVTRNLNAPISDWVEALSNDSLKGEFGGNIETYNMRVEIKKLENMYNNNGNIVSTICTGRNINV